MSQVVVLFHPLSRQVIDTDPLISYPGLHVIVATAFNVVPEVVLAFPLGGEGSPQSNNFKIKRCINMVKTLIVICLSVSKILRMKLIMLSIIT